MADQEVLKLREAMAQRPVPKDIGERRTATDAVAKAFPTAPDIERQKVSANGVEAEWTTAPGADPSRALLYLHGGGYVVGSIKSHRHLASEIGRAIGGRSLALNYRLAPEHPFPAAVDDALAGYRYLLTQGFEPQRIAIAGDSAGGGLVVSALVGIREAGLPQPACGWAISPWVDMEGLGPSMRSLAGVDPMVQREGLLDMARLYLNGADPRSPLAAPLYANLRGIAPLLIHVGAAETLLDDATRLAGAAGAADVPVTLEVWPEMIHVWHLFHQRLTAGQRAIQAGAGFVRGAMGETRA